jgi:hypothetical protein
VGHAHVHTPHELTEPREAEESAPPPRSERRLELISVLLLALTTLATAWCGYQAARWSGEQSQHYARASAIRINARQAGDKRLATIYQRRFRPEFDPAFRAWLAQRPFTNPRAIPGPLYMPQYRLADLALSAKLDATADALYTEGTDAKSNDDRYIFATVFFAAVLFFAGISLRLDWRPLKVAVLGMALTLLVGGAAFVFTLPLA